jgi:hypothetical protein
MQFKLKVPESNENELIESCRENSGVPSVQKDLPFRGT